MAYVGEADILVGADASGFEASMHRAIGSMSRSIESDLGRSIGDLGRSMENVGGSLTRSITVPALGAATAVGGITAALGWKRLTSVDTAQGQLRGLGYEAEDVERISGQLSKALEGGMMTMGEATSAAAGAMAAGVEEGAELTRYIQLLDAAVVGGSGSFDEMNQIFSRVVDQGKLTRGEFDMMAQRMPGFSSAVREAMGVSTEEMYKMLSAGEITADDFLDIMDDFAGDMATSYAGTMEGMAQNTLAYVGIIGESLLGGVFEKSKESLGEFLDFLSSDEVLTWAEETGAVIGEVFSSVLDWVMDAIKWFSELSTPWKIFAGVIAGAAVAAGPILIILGKLIGVAMSIGSAITVAGSALAGYRLAANGARIGSQMLTGATSAQTLAANIGAAAHKAFAGAVRIASGAIKGLFRAMFKNPLGIIITALVVIGGALYAFFTQTEKGRELWDKLMTAMEPIIELVQEIGGAVMDLATEIFDAFASADSATEGFAGAFEVIAPLIQKVVDTVGPLITGLVEMIGEVFQQIVPLVMPAIQSIGEAFGQILEAVGPLIPMFLEAGQQIIEAFLPVVEIIYGELIPVLMELVATVVPMLLDVFAQVVPIVLEVIGAIAPLIATLISELVPVILDVAMTVIPLLIGVFMSIIPVILQVIQAILPLVVLIIETLVPVIQILLDVVVTVFEAIAPIIEAALAVVIAIIETVIAVLQGDWSAAWEGIKNILSAAWDLIVSIVEGAIKIVWGIIQAALDLIVVLWEAIWSLIGDTVKAVWDWIKDTISAGVDAIWGFIQSGLQAIRDFFGNIWNWIVDTVKKAFNWIVESVTWGITTARNFVTNGLNTIRDTFSRIWNAILSLIKSVVARIVSAVMNFVNNVKNNIRDGFNNAKDMAINAFQSLKDGVIQRAESVVNWVKGLPGKIKSALGNLGDLLLNAGRDIMNGLRRGINEAWEGVKNRLSSITDMIPSWKGPPQRDETLLLDAGRLVMQGFDDGLQDSIPSIRKTLGSFTDALPDMLDLNTTVGGRLQLPKSAIHEPSAAEREASGAGGPVIQGPLIQVDSMTVDSDQRVKQLSQELWTRANRMSRAHGDTTRQGVTFR